MPTPPNQWPLHRFPLVDTHSPDEFRFALVKHFGALWLNVNADPQQFVARRSYVRIKNVDLVFGACSDAFQVHFPSVTMVKQPFALKGAGQTKFGGSQYDISTTESVVVPAGVEMTHAYEAGFQSLLFRAEAAALQAKLSAMAGMPITRAIEFVPHSNLESPAVRRLRRLLEFMVSELDRDDEKLPAAALVEF